MAGPLDARRLHVIDAHSPLVGEREPAAYAVEHPADPTAIVRALERAAKEHPGAVILLDSLSALLDRSDAATFAKLLPRVLAVAKASRFTAALFTMWPYDAEATAGLAGFDASIHLRAVEERVVLHQSLAVERTAWSKGATTPPMLYKVTRPGGVLAYVPKVVVLGPHGAGKSTFVQAVSDNAMSVDRMGTTVAMDRGTATFEGVRTEVFGTPGQERFDPLLPSLAQQAVAAVLLVDATKPDTFSRAKQMLEKVWRRGLVVTIALNKSDLPGALTPDAARARLAVPADVDVVACNATRPETARRVLAGLVQRVLTGGLA